MENQVLQAGPDDARMRVDAFLCSRLEISRARAREISKSAQLNGGAVKASTTVKEGDELVFDPGVGLDKIAKTQAKFSAEQLARPLEFLYQDDDILVLNKPRDLSVHPGAGEVQVTLVDLLRARQIPLSDMGPLHRNGIVHRLDKDTSGVMLVAKTNAAHEKLAAAFQNREIDKKYWALCCGVPPTRGRIEAPIARSNSNRKKMSVQPEGRASVTEYKVEQKWSKFAQLSVDLLTGRTHQIRVHLGYISHAVVGDPLYGGLHRALDCAPNPQTRAAIEALGAQALHARSIAFAHPITGELMKFFRGAAARRNGSDCGGAEFGIARYEFSFLCSNFHALCSRCFSWRRASIISVRARFTFRLCRLICRFRWRWFTSAGWPKSRAASAWLCLRRGARRVGV